MTGPPNPTPLPPYVPHDTGKEARRRVMVGLAGLVFMLLLVMLAGFLTEQARQRPDDVEAAVPSPTEPLGDVRVDASAAVAPPVAEPVGPVVPGADGSITVPDLQPDPQLEASKRRQ